MLARLSLALALLLLVATARAGLIFTSNTVDAYGACSANPLMNASSVRSFVPTDECVQTPPSLAQAFVTIGAPFTAAQYVVFACGGDSTSLMIQVRSSGTSQSNVQKKEAKSL
jgi:hypothetical protein